MLDSWLAYLYAPILPFLRKIKITRAHGRRYNPRDILLPEGYVAEVVATGFNAPVHCSFDASGFCYVSEAGHKIDSKPRIVKVNVETGEQETFFALPRERWQKTGAFTGTCWLQGQLYFMNTSTGDDRLGALSRLTDDGQIEDVVTGLPWGDHQPNYPVVGPDGKIYWGNGTATNTGVVGADNFAYEWLPHFPDGHDIPGQDITLTGRNYDYQNVLGDVLQTIQCGAYVPFGTTTSPGQVVKGQTKCSGSVLRWNPETGEVELVAWGLRNPYGIAFHPDGRLFATEHDIDERSRRYIVGDYEDIYEIQEGAWYGWPDFASGIRLDDPYWGDGGQGREPVIADHPDPHPPKPFVILEPHVGINGIDVCHDAAFGFEGDAFVALFGDLTPVTARLRDPAGFKVVRVDMQTRRVVNFAVNKIEGPASKLPHSGFERPSHCQFGPDGALYVVDWGQIEIAPERGGIRMPKGTGSLWRIRRTEGPRGYGPSKPVVLPLYLFQLLALIAGVIATAAAVIALIRRARLLHR